jgi:Zn-dependent peptidase ImmA (M78 family)
MPLSLLKMAYEHGIVLEYWDFQPPLEAVYWAAPGLPPVIGLSNSLFKSRAYFRCVLAEELGHHFTTVGQAIPRTFFHYSHRNRLRIARAEYQAMSWAAQYLVPHKKLSEALKKGIIKRWELAEYFDVTEEMINFRLKLQDFKKEYHQ